MSYETQGVVTTVGITESIRAGSTGPQMNVAGFRIGSLSATEGAQALVTDVDVDEFVYAGDLSAMSYNQVDEDTLIWRIKLDSNVGNFDVGNVGIILEGGVLLCKGVLVGKSYKYKSNPPTTVGNVRFYNIVMRLANVAGLINLSVIEANTAALPEVATQLDLPDPLTTPYNTYLVRNHTRTGRPSTAIRLNDEWFHASHKKPPNQGSELVVSDPALFATSAVVGRAVFLNTLSNLYELADGSDANKQPLGIRTSLHEITRAGMVPAEDVGLTAPLTFGTLYYAGVGPDIGKLVTTANGKPIAYACSSEEVQCICAGPVGITNEFNYESIGIDVTGDNIAPDVVPGSVVYLDMTGSVRTWKRADPSAVGNLDDYTANRPEGVINQTRTRVVVLGAVKISTTTVAWPKPLQLGALYYCDVNTAAGRITRNGNISRWIVGFALFTDTLFVNMLELASDADHTGQHPTKVKAATPYGVSKMIEDALGGLVLITPSSGDMIEVTSEGVVNFRVERGTSDATIFDGDLWPRSATENSGAAVYSTSDQLRAWLAASTAEIRSADAPTAKKFLTPKEFVDAKNWITLTDGPTVNWNMATGTNAILTLGGNRTISAPTNGRPGETYSLLLVQDVTGGRTVTWHANFDWGAAGPPALSTIPNKADLIVMRCVAANNFICYLHREKPNLTIQVFTSSGLYTPAPGTRLAIEIAIGAGGGGGSYYGEGGGSGALAVSLINNPTSKTVTVGAGGVGAGNGSAGVGSAGGATSIGTTTVAGGGGGGGHAWFTFSFFYAGAAGVPTAGNLIQAKGNPGVLINGYGYGGSNGGDSFLGGSGVGAPDNPWGSTPPGGVGSLGGGGGGGAGSPASAGGNGGDGIAIILELK